MAKRKKRKSDTRNETTLSDSRACLYLIGLSFLAFGQTIWFDYTYLDDQALILQNLPYLTRPENILRLFLIYLE